MTTLMINSRSWASSFSVQKLQDLRTLCICQGDPLAFTLAITFPQHFVLFSHCPYSYYFSNI